MFKKEEKENFKDAETIIGPSVVVKGNFNSSGNIVVEGTLHGGVKTAGNVFVGNRANVTADIEAKSARIGGEIKGNLKIEEHLEITSSAKITGDLECASLAVESGAILSGKVSMTKNFPSEKKTEKNNQLLEAEK